ILAGDGTERAALEERARRRGSADRVRFLGATERPRVIGLLRGAAAVACPSRFEGLPLVCVEAFAAGRPVVASGVNGIPEPARDGDTALPVPPDDCAALASALGRLLDRPEEAARLAARGRALVERDYRWPAIARRYLALCESVRNSRAAAA